MPNLVPRVSHLNAWGLRDPGNEVAICLDILYCTGCCKLFKVRVAFLVIRLISHQLTSLREAGCERSTYKTVIGRVISVILIG